MLTLPENRGSRKNKGSRVQCFHSASCGIKPRHLQKGRDGRKDRRMERRTDGQVTEISSIEFSQLHPRSVHDNRHHGELTVSPTIRWFGWFKDKELENERDSDRLREWRASVTSTSLCSLDSCGALRAVGGSCREALLGSWLVYEFEDVPVAVKVVAVDVEARIPVSHLFPCADGDFVDFDSGRGRLVDPGRVRFMNTGRSRLRNPRRCRPMNFG